MPRNILLVHLEAMPQLQFWQYQTQLPTLWRLREDSMYFSRCFTTGSATVFAYNSVFRGSIDGLDHIETYDYEQSHKINTSYPSFVAELRDKHEYQTAFMLYNTNIPVGAVPQEDAEYGFTAFLADNPYDSENTEFRKWVNGLDKEKPFLIYMHFLIDLLHQRMPRELLAQHMELSLGDMSALMMRQLDRSVDNSLERFRQAGLLDNAVSVVFGDHGWDYQSRFNSSKFEQGAYVSSASSWVPLYIHNSSLGRGTTDRLISLDDFPATLFGLLDVGGSPFVSKGLFPGWNILETKREFAYTQNKFALQNTTVRGHETPKAYAVTDGQYRLTVQDVNQKEKTGGMSLYLEQLDPGNQVDLLSLFVLDGEGAIAGLNHDALRRGTLMSYPPLINIPGLKALARIYETLRSRLLGYVRDKEQQALKQPGAQPHILSREAFLLSATGWDRSPGNGLDEAVGRIRGLALGDRPLVLFGSRTFITSYVLAVLDYYELSPIGILDNMKSEHHGALNGLRIYPPEEAAQKFPGAAVVSCICSSVSDIETRKQCLDLGLEYISYMSDILGSKLW